MKNLVQANVDAKEILEAIVKTKRGQRGVWLRSKLSVISARYDDYVTYSNAIETINRLSWLPQERDDLNNCYTAPSQPLIRLKHLIIAAQSVSRGRICPYCSVDTWQDFEHYLPKENFPEYAVFALNLIPCCTKCNRKKGTTFLVNNERQFLHFYCDIIPVSRFLEVQIEFELDHPFARFSLINSELMSPDFFALLTNHYTKLDLLERFSVEAASVFAQLVTSVREHSLLTYEEIQAFLRAECNSYEGDFSNNYWKSVLYEKLCSDIDALRQLLSPHIEYLGAI